MKVIATLILCIPVTALLLLAQTSAQNAQSSRFIAVEGASLRARMEAAAKKHRDAGAQTNFWTAYSFDVRSGVAVDPGNSVQFAGSMNSYSGMTVFTGKVNGMTVETKNLGVFTLHEPGGGKRTRLEIYNLDNPREYGGYPVYWLGRGGNEESLAYLRGVVEADEAHKLVEHATVAIALHDDPRVVGILKEFVRRSTSQEVRSAAVHWLGDIGGEDAFLADLVRDEAEHKRVREAAAHALGRSENPASLNTLTSLYGTIANREVKKSLIHSIFINANEAPAIEFLIKLAKTEPDRETRQQALFWLGRKAGERTLGVLRDAVEGTDADTEVQKHAVFVISRRPKDEAVPLLIKIARTHAKPQVREQAVFWLGRTGDERALKFFEELLAK